MLVFDQSRGNLDEFSFKLNLEKESVVYSEECENFLDTIRYIISEDYRRVSNPHVPDKNRGVSISTYYSKPVFLGMMFRRLELECCG